MKDVSAMDLNNQPHDNQPDDSQPNAGSGIICPICGKVNRPGEPSCNCGALPQKGIWAEPDPGDPAPLQADPDSPQPDLRQATPGSPQPDPDSPPANPAASLSDPSPPFSNPTPAHSARTSQPAEPRPQSSFNWNDILLDAQADFRNRPDRFRNRQKAQDPLGCGAVGTGCHQNTNCCCCGCPFFIILFFFFLMMISAPFANYEFQTSYTPQTQNTR